MGLVIGNHHAAIREHDFSRERIVERKTEPADQRTIPATQREFCHPDGATEAGHRRNVEWVRYGSNI
jgi:hypothetical protein